MNPPSDVIEAITQYGIPYHVRYMAYSISNRTVILLASFRGMPKSPILVSCPVRIYAAALSQEDRVSLQLNLDAIQSSVPEKAWHILDMNRERRLIVLDGEGNTTSMDLKDKGT
ncbi:hypothetical protein ASPBRDRAFT_48964 [Aspergillus brasiliensis CBS 101740]|nr:hypothetical protein ASPBRDRAFT_48964 [Aspergillus brasiliensis CBS 101740]